MAAADQGDVMTLVYTSGTTGPPKGAMLTNANAEYSMGTVINGPGRIPDGRPPNPSDMILTYLPLCHVAERIFSTWTMLADGVVLNFAESIETVQANLREVQPTLFFAVPRILEKIHATILIKGLDATLLKRLLFRGSMRLADVIGKQKVANGGDHTLDQPSALRARVLPSYSAPCASGSDCAAVVGPVRGQRRSPLRSSGSSSASGSRCTSCTG